MDFLSSFDFSKDLSLYVHVPFCTSKCSYCAFYSEPCRSASEMDAYTDLMARQIRKVVSLMDGRPFETVFFGGGNPGCLGERNLGLLAREVCANGQPVEFSTEMNPESLTDGMAPLFGKYFTRLSMGVQSLDQKALSFLGRNASLSQTVSGMVKACELKARTGIDLSFDLISCLGSWHDALSDVRTICSYGPDHLSVYALSLEEGTALYRRDPVLPDADGQYEVLSSISEYLASCGYEQYEVSNYAKPGHRSLHNSRYWALKQYLGLGPGAASTALKNGLCTRYSYAPDFSLWLGNALKDSADAGFDMALEKEVLSSREVFEELVFLGLRHRRGIDCMRLSEAAGSDGILLDVEALIEKCKHVEIINNYIVPDTEGMLQADGIWSLVMDNYDRLSGR